MYRPDFNQIAKSLDMIIPEKITEFIDSLNEFTITCGNMEWDIWNDTDGIVEYSKSFSKELKLKLVVIADNGIGDHLLLLSKQENSSPQKMRESIYVLQHESATIKRYSQSFEEALNFTDDDDFLFKKTFVYRLDKTNELIKGTDD